jgi:hydroxymethylpyrimidine pyrophosphatase-like HAD family hydrolase/fructoselysine-6-P-deglycase FrlB-like protein
MFFVSAEGKNPDIVEALQRARRHSARDLHVITNKAESPLQVASTNFLDVTVHNFQLDQKDGYLATNSLILDAVLVARAYEELDKQEAEIPLTLDELELREKSVDAWVETTEEFAKFAARRRGIIILHSPALKPVAADLESKLSESALLHTQVADLRSFAHGRHSWLTQRSEDNVVLALVDPSSERLWQATYNLFPKNVVSLTLAIPGARPRDLLAALIAELKLVSMLSRALGKDPAKPDVAQFGRDLYYIDLPRVVETPDPETGSAELSKFSVLGAHWPSITHIPPMKRHAQAARTAICNRSFRAIVFDYDGTLGSSSRRDLPPAPATGAHLERLIRHGVIVGVASGRGDSIRNTLRAALPEDCWNKVWLGLYNGGWIGDLSSDESLSSNTSEFLNHASRIVNTLKHSGVPIDKIDVAHPNQVSIRFQPGIEAFGMWLVIVDALRQAGVDTSNVVRSRHSVDILASGISKSKLITHLVQVHKIDPYEILTMGDQGAWPGNDSSLLDHKFSLSVATPSRKIDRGWKFVCRPRHRPAAWPR